MRIGGRTWRLLPEELAGAGDDIARQPESTSWTRWIDGGRDRFKASKGCVGCSSVALELYFCIAIDGAPTVSHFAIVDVAMGSERSSQPWIL